jgi:hypothetical protein
MLGRTRIALLAGVFALGIAGCGGNDGTIPPDNSQQLQNMLTLLQHQIDTGDCAGAQDSATEIDDAVAKLPDSVDPEVQDALSKGAENLTELSKDPSQCNTGASGEEGAQTSTTSTTSTTTTETTSSTPETTTETTSTTPEDTPPANTPPGHETPSPGNVTPPGGGNETGGPRGGDEGGPASGGIVPPGQGRR